MSSLLNEIQQKLKVPKSQYNAFAKYNYRNAEDILEAVKPLLGDATLVLTDEVVQVGNRNYVKATATLNDYDKVLSIDRHYSAVGWACEEETKKGMDAAQITGAASSYARKYALNGLFCIDDTKDADNHDNTEKASTAPKTAPTAKKEDDRTLAAKDRIYSLLGLLKVPRATKSDIETAVKKMTKLDLLPENYDAIGEALSAQLEQREAKQ